MTVYDATSIEAELKPCPFCGREDFDIVQNEDASKTISVYCLGYCILGGHRLGDFTSVEHFAEWWNIRALPVSPAPTSEPSPLSDEDKAYELGKVDGYSEAVAEIDRLTGGDGEYRYCMGGGEQHCPDPETMKARIVGRFPAPGSAADGGSDAIGETVEKPREAFEPFARAALWDIATERDRQIAVEGWTPEHDDSHSTGELAGAAACYALNGITHWAALMAVKTFWPWDGAWWKPKSRRQDLIRAGALIVAEIERLDRLPTPPLPMKED